MKKRLTEEQLKNLELESCGTTNPPYKPFASRQPDLIGYQINNTLGASVSETGGLRFNRDKPRLSMVPPELEAAVAEVLWKSAKENGGKYPMNNWKKGLPLTEVVDSLLRHTKAFAHSLHDQDLDPESKLHHIKHAAANVAMILHFISNEKYSSLDDRDS